jgi:glycine oxidase
MPAQGVEMIDVEPRRVVVVGAGVIGLACAWRIAQRLPAAVTVVDPRPGSGASAVAAGMLAPVTEAHPTENALLSLALVAAERYPAFVADLTAASGEDPGYLTTGTLAVAFDADDRAELDALAARLAGLGLAAEPLGARECRRLEPGLAPEIRGGLRVDGDRSVDNRRLVHALAAAAGRAGVRQRSARAERVLDAGGRVTGVALHGGGAEPADAVVLAAGCWSGALHPSLDGLVRPVKGEILRLRPGRGAVPVRRTVRATVQGQPVYLVPRSSGELVVGATQQEAGFDATVTAGGVHTLLRDARAVVPGIDEYELAEAAAGLRPGSPDNAPLIGAIGPAGLLAATGHHRNGMLLAGVTADAVAALLAEGRLPAFAAAADPARFVRAAS